MEKFQKRNTRRLLYSSCIQLCHVTDVTQFSCLFPTMFPQKGTVWRKIFARQNFRELTKKTFSRFYFREWNCIANRIVSKVKKFRDFYCRECCRIREIRENFTPQKFCAIRQSSCVFIPPLFSYILQVQPYMQLNFTETFYP